MSLREKLLIPKERPEKGLFSGTGNFSLRETKLVEIEGGWLLEQIWDLLQYPTAFRFSPIGNTLGGGRILELVRYWSWSDTGSMLYCKIWMSEAFWDSSSELQAEIKTFIKVATVTCTGKLCLSQTAFIFDTKFRLKSISVKKGKNSHFGTLLFR